MSRSVRVASDLDKYREPKAGLVFRYDYLRPRELAEGVEHGKARPARILLPLIEGEPFRNVSVIEEASNKTTANYVAAKNDIAIICIQPDQPGKDQHGVKLDLATKQYIGLPINTESWAIVSEINIDTWPSGNKPYPTPSKSVRLSSPHAGTNDGPIGQALSPVARTRKDLGAEKTPLYDAVIDSWLGLPRQWLNPGTY
jgi:hypothetical protein